jgi:SnoaL-like domain
VGQLRKLALSVHSISNAIDRLRGDRAFVECHYAVIHRLSTFLGYTDYFHHGRYIDIFERRDGEWRIATRVICQDGERWLQMANLTTILATSPNLPAQGTQNRSDPMYLGFDIGRLVKRRPVNRDLWSGFYRLAIVPLLVVRVVAIVLSPIYRSWSRGRSEERDSGPADGDTRG